jgi:hypothetical protein
LVDRAGLAEGRLLRRPNPQGAKPEDRPVELPTEFEFVFDLKIIDKRRPFSGFVGPRFSTAPRLEEPDPAEALSGLRLEGNSSSADRKSPPSFA